ncbi:hypothetical protein [Paludibacter sp.]|uniref:hypothetical protein n=1 Tax=Paludibacter sp. TaxID=1898105 RepID=UPI0013550BB4|nr:hypothetical protein [Paludibacter sp.]MTK53861.1 hypothetical protein [Paludibacter sp.]
MKNCIAIVLILFLVSCKSEAKKNETTTSDINRTISADSLKSTPGQAFDWSMPKKLLDEFRKDLVDSKNRKDLALVTFLNRYKELTVRFSDSLYHRPNYADLNTLSYSEDGKISKNALEFKRKVINSGFNLTSSEGDTYVIENTGFIKNGTFKYLDKISIDFLNLYCNEIDTVCCDDAAIVIPLEILINRAYKWGEMTNRVSNTAYQKIALENYKDYLFLIFFGVDNTLAFDGEVNKYNQKLFDLMISQIKKHPLSKASIDFKQFTSLLIKENYQKTSAIEKFIKLKTKK